MHAITEKQFERLCSEIVEDQGLIQTLNPALSKKEAGLWILLGSLVNLLSVPEREQSELYDPSQDDPYLHAILELLQNRTLPVFNPRKHLVAMIEQLKD
jgi:hypothetical protein